MGKREVKNARQVWLRIIFLLYVAAMLWLLLGQRWGTQIYTQQLADGINLTPFNTIGRYVSIIRYTESAYLLRHAVYNLAGNVLLFVPLGFFLPWLGRKLRGFFKTLLFAACLIVTVELVQYFTFLGSCDVDDLILNLTGVALGYPIWRLNRR